jgi:hypothetical protein
MERWDIIFLLRSLAVNSGEGVTGGGAATGSAATGGVSTIGGTSGEMIENAPFAIVSSHKNLCQSSVNFCNYHPLSNIPISLRSQGRFYFQRLKTYKTCDRIYLVVELGAFSPKVIR